MISSITNMVMKTGNGCKSVKSCNPFTPIAFIQNCNRSRKTEQYIELKFNCRCCSYAPKTIRHPTNVSLKQDDDLCLTAKPAPVSTTGTIVDQNKKLKDSKMVRKPRLQSRTILLWWGKTFRIILWIHVLRVSSWKMLTLNTRKTNGFPPENVQMKNSR